MPEKSNGQAPIFPPDQTRKQGQMEVMNPNTIITSPLRRVGPGKLLIDHLIGLPIVGAEVTSV